MISLDQNVDDYNNDFRAMIQAFYQEEKIVLQETDTRFTFRARFSENLTELSLLVQGTEISRGEIVCDYLDKSSAKNSIKAEAYRLISEFEGRLLPWGTLTGIRPTKIATEHLENRVSDEDIIRDYEETYLTTKNKGIISLEVAKKEVEIYQNILFEEEYSIYIGIPFCPSTCLYCSFTSYPIGLYRDKVEAYIEALKKEFIYVANKYKNKRLTTIYVGGGTPSSLSAAELDKLITYITTIFDITSLREFTVEAGRPDSITREKLQVLKRHGVNRISINPQTMKNDTLKLIGRGHSSEDTISAFTLARELGFTNINMDIIIGLPGEDIEDIRYTLEEITILAPDSLTVHSLAIKRAANLNIKMEEYRSLIKGSTNEMIDLVDSYARKLNLEPYYLYRQKNIPGNLENIGYSTKGKECLYNILIMEEKMDIIAMGAGASTKLVYPQENRIERVENVKNVDDYINRIDEMIHRKEIKMS